MYYNGKTLYIEFRARHCTEIDPYDIFFPYNKISSFFISRDVYLFMRLVLYKYYDNEIFIYKSLEDEGIKIKDQWEYNNKWRYLQTKKQKKVASLQYICHEIISKNKKLQSQITLLPKTIANNVKDYIRVDMAISSYSLYFGHI